MINDDINGYLGVQSNIHDFPNLFPMDKSCDINIWERFVDRQKHLDNLHAYEILEFTGPNKTKAILLFSIIPFIVHINIYT